MFLNSNSTSLPHKKEENIFYTKSEHKGLLNKFDINSSCHLEHLWYKVIKDKVYFPWRYYEMYLIDYLEDLNIEVTVKEQMCSCPLFINSIENIELNNSNIDSNATNSSDNNIDKQVYNNNNNIVMDNHYYIMNREGKKACSVDSLYQVQVYSFNAEKWLPEIQNLELKLNQKLMLSKTFLLELTKKDFKDLQNCHNNLFIENTNLHLKIDQFLNEEDKKEIPYWFIKLGSVSPKDLFGDQGTKIKFKNSKEIIRTLVTSNRTWSTIKSGFETHLVFKEWKEIPHEYEFRCFIYKDKLRAISQYGFMELFFEGLSNYQNLNAQKNLIKRIENFYNVIKNYIPYQDCIMDIIVWDENCKESVNELGIFLIEFNCFGAESPAGSALFSWITDKHLLYYSNSPVLRLYTNNYNAVNDCDNNYCNVNNNSNNSDSMVDNNDFGVDYTITDVTLI